MVLEHCLVIGINCAKLYSNPFLHKEITALTQKEMLRTDRKTEERSALLYYPFRRGRLKIHVLHLYYKSVRVRINLIYNADSILHKKQLILCRADTKTSSALDLEEKVLKDTKWNCTSRSLFLSCTNER